MFLFFIIIIGILIYLQYYLSSCENFTNSIPKYNKIIDNNDNIYDEFYSKLYSKLFPTAIKIKYEINDIKTNAIIPYINNDSTSTIKILDIGCGLGDHVKVLSDLEYDVIGIDKSADMIKSGKLKYNLRDKYLQCNDALIDNIYNKNTFSHILCMYFTYYYFKEPKHILNNIHKWLKPDGYFVVHLVNRNKFDPILEASSPFPAFSKQKYTKNRITQSDIIFNNINYSSNFTINEKENRGYLTETFISKNNDYHRKQTHTLYMSDHEEIVNYIKTYGFQLVHMSHLLDVEYEYQYLYYFKCLKPN